MTVIYDFLVKKPIARKQLCLFTIRRFAVFGLILNMFVNKHSCFLAIGFLTSIDVRGTL